MWTQRQLEAWGERVGAGVEEPVLFALRGELGAGKSVLARAIARGAGVTTPMPSPTFNLLFRYEGTQRDVVHIDLYRLEHPAEVWDLGWRELDDARAIVLVEWPERAESLLPGHRWDVHLEPAGPDMRRVTLRPHGRVPALPPLPPVTGT